jgi:hypothetical protein
MILVAALAMQAHLAMAGFAAAVIPIRSQPPWRAPTLLACDRRPPFEAVLD